MMSELNEQTDAQAEGNFAEGLARVEDEGRKANTEFYGAKAYTPGKDEGRTGFGLATQIDVSFIYDGAHDTEPSDVRIVLHPSQGAKLIELLKLHVDLDVVALDNGEPETAAFVRDLIAVYEQEDVPVIGTSVSVRPGERHAFRHETEVTGSARGCQQWLRAGSDSQWCDQMENDAIHRNAR